MRLIVTMLCSLALACEATTSVADESEPTRDTSGRQLLTRWTEAVGRLDRMSVRFEMHCTNTVFETIEVSKCYFAREGKDRWVFRKEAGEQPASKRRPVYVGRFRAEAAHPMQFIATPDSLFISCNKKLTQFERYDWPPASALRVENAVESPTETGIIGFWNTFARSLRLRYDVPHLFPLYFPMSDEVTNYDIELIQSAERGDRLKLTRKPDALDSAYFKQLDAIFRPGSDLPYAIRCISSGLEHRYMLDELLLGEQAEIDAESFHVPNSNVFQIRKFD